MTGHYHQPVTFRAWASIPNDDTRYSAEMATLATKAVSATGLEAEVEVDPATMAELVKYDIQIAMSNSPYLAGDATAQAVATRAMDTAADHGARPAWQQVAYFAAERDVYQWFGNADKRDQSAAKFDQVYSAAATQHLGVGLPDVDAGVHSFGFMGMGSAPKQAPPPRLVRAEKAASTGPTTIELADVAEQESSTATGAELAPMHDNSGEALIIAALILVALND